MMSPDLDYFCFYRITRGLSLRLFLTCFSLFMILLDLAPGKAEVICAQEELYGRVVTRCVARDEFEAEHREYMKLLKKERLKQIDGGKRDSAARQLVIDARFLASARQQGLPSDYCRITAALAVKNHFPLITFDPKTSFGFKAELVECQLAVVARTGYIPYGGEARALGWIYDPLTKYCYRINNYGVKVYGTYQCKQDLVGGIVILPPD